MRLLQDAAIASRIDSHGPGTVVMDLGQPKFSSFARRFRMWTPIT